MKNIIVSTKWLRENLDNKDLIILDGSLGKKEARFEGIRIKGARVFDIKNHFSDSDSLYPNTLPSAEAFAKKSRELGINAASKIVVYDAKGIYSSPRVWWMFRAMGHENIAVLNGGLPEWVAKGYATDSIQPDIYPMGDFQAKLDSQKVNYFADVLKNIDSEKCLLLDARSEGRFLGTAPEPREGLASGHIPKSISLPFQKVLENGKYKSKEELSQIFQMLNLDKRPLIFSCGSGITACIILLACELISDREKAVYDGSWTEWAMKTQGKK